MLRYLFLFIMLLTLTACTEYVKVDVAGVGETIPTGPSALAWDGKNLIIAKEGLVAFLENIDTAATGSIYNYEGHYFFDRYPLTITSKENPPYITGLAWEKTSGGTGYIWVADAANKRILKISPQGDVVRKINIPAVYLEDITFDGEYLWAADSKRGKIFKLNTADGSVAAEYLSPVTVPTALAWDGKYLIIAGIIDPNFLQTTSENVKIVKLDTNSGKVVEIVLIPKHFAQHLSSLSMPAGMAWINNKIWISDRNSGNIVILSDWTIASEDTKNYKLATVTPTFKKVKVEEKEKDRDIDEAKRAAEEARKAAEEAKRAAEAAKKAFELQQKK
ncbi:MAG: hypothetical protein N3A00_02930 [Thermodesulfovibrio sp.]|nr:hypothetical protein [Thermodesulfovibrio sp.]